MPEYLNEKEIKSNLLFGCFQEVKLINNLKHHSSFDFRPKRVEGHSSKQQKILGDVIMLKKLVIAIVCSISYSSAFAGDFDGGSGEFDQPEYPRYSESEIQKKIQNEMGIACSGNLCKIVGTDSSGDGWTVSFNVGYGDQANGSGDTFIIGGEKPSGSSSDRAYAGITVSYSTYSCQSSLRVTPSVYRFVNTYMYNMVNSDGSTKRNFSPADQTVILFYTTMLNKVEACKAVNAK